jgi:hypothetical protein
MLFLCYPLTPSLLKATSPKHVLQQQQITRNFLWQGSIGAGRGGGSAERLPLARAGPRAPPPRLHMSPPPPPQQPGCL